MKFFFDNCTSPVLAATLDGFVRHSGHSAHHISALPCGRDAPDIEWIGMLASDETVWVVITGDERIRRNKAERAAFRSAGLRGFVLQRSHQKIPMHQVASFLLWHWQAIEQLVAIVGGAALYEVPMSRRGRIKLLPL